MVNVTYGICIATGLCGFIGVPNFALGGWDRPPLPYVGPWSRRSSRRSRWRFASLTMPVLTVALFGVELPNNL